MAISVLCCYIRPIMRALVIPPRRSLAISAALAMLMVVVSYLLILFLAIACVYLPWLVITHMANFQTLALFVGGVVVAASMLWSLVPRRDKFAVPGLLLDPVLNPRLFAEIDRLAFALEEPVPCEVYLIGQPNAWVADRGGLVGFGSRRVLGLGLPLLATLNVSQFRAILAHEFAHYYGGDTKLGPWVHRTQTAMIRTFQNMGSVGKTMRVALMQVLYVVVFGILKWYWLLFLRAINYVSRRQEFRADELACILAGPQPFMSGLRTVHEASMAWPSYWNTEVGPMLNSGFLPSIAEGFAQYLSAPAIANLVDKAIETEMRAGKTKPYDSHPLLRDRLAAAQALPSQSHPEDKQSALSLLEDGGAAELAFLEALNPQMSKNSLKRVSWDEKGPAVLIPSWAGFVGQYAPLLQGITAGNLSESTGKVPEIAAQIRDPKGMLLTPEQRIDRARSLLSSALGLALVNSGWKVHSRPGEFHLDHGGEQINPHKLILQIADGTISKEAWKAKCTALGIENIPLAIAVGSISEPRQEALPFG
jgi:heat shock protein HtpX